MLHKIEFKLKCLTTVRLYQSLLAGPKWEKIFFYLNLNTLIWSYNDVRN